MTTAPKPSTVAESKAEVIAKAEATAKAKAEEIAKVEAKKHELKIITAAIDPAMVSPKVFAPDGRFEKLINGVVRDKQSGLDWYAGPDKNTGWDEANAWASGLKVDGGGLAHAHTGRV